MSRMSLRCKIIFFFHFIFPKLWAILVNVTKKKPPYQPKNIEKKNEPQYHEYQCSFEKKKSKVHISHEFRSLIRTSLMIFFFSFHFIRVVKHAQILSIFLFDVYLFESNRVKTNARHAYVWDRGNGWRVCLPHQYLENNDFAAATIELFYLFFFRWFCSGMYWCTTQ